MRILYVTTARIPTEKAHGLQIVKMCEAFAELGHEVELVVPKRGNAITEDPFTYYDVEKNFKIRELPSLDTVAFGLIGFWLHRLSFARAARRYLASRGADLIYGRDELVLAALRTTVPCVYEVHEGRWNRIVRRAAQRATTLVVISRGLRDFFQSHGVDAKNILVAPDAVEYEQFAHATPAPLRDELGISPDVPVALYTGHLYAWKGAHTLAEAARLMPDIHVVLVGGTDNDISTFKREFGQLENVHIVGRKLHKAIPGYVKAADVLVLPNSAKEDISRLYTSPIKLFEYMASGRPIVAADIPSIREILNVGMAIFFRPDDPQDLARAVHEVLADSSVSQRRADVAQREAVKYGWSERAKRIIDAFAQLRGK